MYDHDETIAELFQRVSDEDLGGLQKTAGLSAGHRDKPVLRMWLLNACDAERRRRQGQERQFPSLWDVLEGLDGKDLAGALEESAGYTLIAPSPALQELLQQVHATVIVEVGQRLTPQHVGD